MAPVNDDDRAQLILVGALTLAAMLVVLAIVVNSGIYSHNLATRSQDPAVPALEFQQNVDDDVGGIVEQSNEEGAGAGSNYGTIYGDYEDRTIAWAAGTGMYGARGGAYVSVDADSNPSSGGMEGVRVVHDDPGVAFESAVGAADWTVSTDAKVRAFQMTVEPVTATSSNPFVVEFDGASTNTVEIYESGGDVVVDDGSVSCSVSGAVVAIDFTAGTVDRDRCAALSFVDDLPSTFDVRYSDGDRVQGTYELTVDRVVDAPGNEAGPFTDVVDAANFGFHCGVSGSPQSTFYGSPAAGSPYVAPGIYSTEIDLRYQSSQVTYETTSRIAPGERGEAATHPVITQFDVTEASTTAGDGTFDIAWATADPNGDPVTVAISVEDPTDPADDGTDGDTDDQSGLASSGSQTFDSEDLTGTYEITITASDGTNTRSVTVWHDDDGDSTGCPP